MWRLSLGDQASVYVCVQDFFVGGLKLVKRAPKGGQFVLCCFVLVAEPLFARHECDVRVVDAAACASWICCMYAYCVALI